MAKYIIEVRQDKSKKQKWHIRIKRRNGRIYLTDERLYNESYAMKKAIELHTDLQESTIKIRKG